MNGKSTVNGVLGWLNHIGERVWRIVVILVSFLGVVAASWGLRYILDMATKLHWLAGLTLSVVLIIILFGLLWLFWRHPPSSIICGKYPWQGLVFNLTFVVLAAIAVMATLSYILHDARLVQYTSSHPITVGRLLDYYAWHLVDSIPVLEIWRVFDVDIPAKGEGFWVGFLVLVFRVLIIAPSIALIKRQLDLRAKYVEFSSIL